MPVPAARPRLADLAGHLVVRIAAHYAAVVLVGALVWRWLPPAAQHSMGDALAPALFGLPQEAPPRGPGAFVAGAVGSAAPAPPPVTMAVAALGAFLLTLPVAWTYMLTREKRGYRQTTVHTLVLLPVVVAGVVVLVKSSLALAFSLAGIVAAVRFRNSLDDSKDATFLFLSTGVGLAAGVELDVAFLLSLLFCAAALLLFYTDFGRTPPALEGERARVQLERALAVANRTSQFVAQVDAEVLRDLAPAQLDALAARLRRRREDTAPDLPPGDPALEFEARLVLACSDADAARPLVEACLAQQVKRWLRDERAEVPAAPNGAGPDVLAYHVRWRKGTTPAGVVEALRQAAGGLLVRVEVQ